MRDLRVAIESFSVDHGDEALTFLDRLARENGWPPAFARRVFHEYRRFLYLAMISPTPVTPSDAVDQAWHLHLCYTQSYWQDLCGDLLGRELHHGPTRGGARQRAKFFDQYTATLDLYRETFGEEPPPAVWPSPEDRFRRNDQFVRINLREHWSIPKATVLRGAALLGSAMLVSGCAVALDGFTGLLLALLFGGVLMLVVAVSATLGSGREKRSERSEQSGYGCGAQHGDGDGDGDSGCGSGAAGCGSGCGGCGS